MHLKQRCPSPMCYYCAGLLKKAAGAKSRLVAPRVMHLDRKKKLLENNPQISTHPTRCDSYFDRIQSYGGAVGVFLHSECSQITQLQQNCYKRYNSIVRP